MDAKADEEPGLEQYAMRAFAEALETIPYALANNSGMSPIETVAEIRKKQHETGNPKLGVDAYSASVSDMKELKVFETESSKVQQIELATQVTRMILKIDDILQPDEGED